MPPLLTEEDRERFLRQGYIVIPGIVPPSDLPELRQHCETMVERQAALWAEAAAADPRDVSSDPRKGTITRGTVSAGGAQPRLFVSYPPMSAQLDRTVRRCVDVWTAGALPEACSFLLGVEDAALTEIFLMCSPSEDHDHLRDWLGWHRDFSPSNGVPLQALTENLVENGPSEREMDVARGGFEGGTVLALEDAGSRMTQIATNLLVRDRVVLIPEYLEKVRAVTAEDVQRVITKVVRGPQVRSIVQPA